MISATTTMAMMAPVVIGYLLGLGSSGRLPACPREPTFDLQSHSTHSDGALAPAEVVAMAADAGVKLLALTDHDTVAGVPEALAAARVKNIDLTPAVELSSVHADAEDLHILGYAIDHADSTLLDALEDFRADRVRRIYAMAERLDLAAAATTRHRAARTSRTRSTNGTPEHDPRRALRRLPHPRRTDVRPPQPPHGRPGDRHHPRRRRARGLGAPVLGRRGPASSFPGLDGVEVFYPTHTEEQTRALHARARAGY